MELTMVPGDQPVRRSRTCFGEAGWAASWAWDATERRFQADDSLTLLTDSAHPSALVGSRSRSTSLVQVSVAGGPACFVLHPPGEPLRLVGDHLRPEPGLSATLLDLLHRCDLEAARVVAAEALGVADSLETPHIQLDFAIGYTLLRIQDELLSNWAKRLTEAYPWSADAHVIMARSLLKDPYRQKEATEHLSLAVNCGLPVVTQGLQLLNDSLNLFHQSSVYSAVLPFATCARTDTVLTTFWGERPDAPRAAPIMALQPPHAVPLGSAADRVPAPREITVAIKALSESCQVMPPQVQRVLGLILLSLQDSLRLASHLAVTQNGRDVAKLSSQLRETLGHGERLASALASRMRTDEIHGRPAGSNTRLLHDQAAFARTANAIAAAKRALRFHADTVARAQTVGHAQAQALGGTTSFAARLAIDTRDAADELAVAIDTQRPLASQPAPDSQAESALTSRHAN
ncbi:hypothetical protein ACIGT4_27145 [Streptomyces sioyaensis]|uniref:hypothetical protein n=1 Tax=Streptomyces sioyaensis TaxID=67364 RepID=UPI0037D5C9AA